MKGCKWSEVLAVVMNQKPNKKGGEAMKHLQILTTAILGLFLALQAPPVSGQFVAGDDSGESTHAGNVGIGTTNPEAALHISNGSRDVGGVIRLHNTAYNTGIGPLGEDAPLGTIEFGSENSNVVNYGLNAVRVKISGVQQNASGGAAIEFRTANSVEVDPAKRMRLMADGNLILTNSDDWAGAKLDVDGNVKIRGGDPGEGKVLTSDADGLATWQAPASGGGGGGGGKFVDGTPNADDAVYTTGNVGIGTAEPAAQLHVSNGNRDVGAIIRLHNTAYNQGIGPLGEDAPMGTVEFGTDQINVVNYGLGPVRASIVGTMQNASGAGAMVFKTANSIEVDQVVRMRLMADGALVISQTGEWASARLDVDGDARIRNIPQDDTLDQVLVSDADGKIRWRAVATIGGGGGGGGGGEGGKFINGIPNANDAVYMDGNVGIGTLEPGAQLHVQNGDRDTGAILRLHNTAYNVGIGPIGEDAPLGTIEFSTDMINVINYGLDKVRGKIQGVMQNASGGVAMEFTTSNSIEQTGQRALRIMADGAVAISRRGGYDGWAGAKLDVDGQIKIRGGGPGPGKVLTSDEDGKATWEESSGGDCVNCSDLQNVVFDLVCKVFGGDFNSLAEVSECVSVVAAFKVVGLNVCETGCIDTIVAATQDLIDSKVNP